MANPFDQYDAKTEVNPFDRYDAAPQQSTASKLWDAYKQNAADIAGGGLRGTGSIGSTLLTIGDLADKFSPSAIGANLGHLTGGDKNLSSLVTGKQQEGYLSKSWHDAMKADTVRRQSMDTTLRDLGTNSDSMYYKGGKLASEIAGTAGAGGLTANSLRAVLPASVESSPLVAKLLESIASNGFRTGAPAAATLGGRAADLGVRAVGGGVSGGIGAGLVNPDQAGTGAAIGAALPVVGAGLRGVSDLTRDARQHVANRLMQSAIKPTIAQLKNGDADTAISTLLQYGINPTRGGVENIQELIGGLNDQIGSKIADSGAMISKQKVLDSLGDVSGKFSKQVSPTADLNAIRSVGEDFAAHPNYPGAEIPIQAAQELKQGTYRILAKKYGQVGAADTEAQKGLARGLKDEIATAVPGISELNAQESRLITTLGVAERRALMEMNKNPMGLSLLSQNPATWAAFMADKSALFKSLAARMVNPGQANQGAGLLSQPLAAPVIRQGLLNY